MSFPPPLPPAACVPAPPVHIPSHASVLPHQPSAPSFSSLNCASRSSSTPLSPLNDASRALALSAVAKQSTPLDNTYTMPSPAAPIVSPNYVSSLTNTGTPKPTLPTPTCAVPATNIPAATTVAGGAIPASTNNTIQNSISSSNNSVTDSGNAVTAVPKPTSPSSDCNANCLSLQAWQRMEEECRRLTKSSHGERYLQTSEVVRDLVYRLFILCDYDMLTMLAKTVSSLQDIGRNDLGLMRNDTSTQFTITQSAVHGASSTDASFDACEQRRRYLAEALQRINNAADVAKRAVNSVVQSISPATGSGGGGADTGYRGSNGDITVRTGVFAPTTYEKLQEYFSQHDHSRAMMPSISSAARAESATCSRSNSDRHSHRNRSSLSDGSYMLYRYGGNFPPEHRYSHYRYYGLDKKL